jgi:hypothetical protein
MEKGHYNAQDNVRMGVHHGAPAANTTNTQRIDMMNRKAQTVIEIQGGSLWSLE